MDKQIQMNFSVEVLGKSPQSMKPYVTFIGYLENTDRKDIGFLFQYIRSHYEAIGEDGVRLHLSLNDFSIEPFKESWVREGLISMDDTQEKIENVFFEQLKTAKEPVMNIRLMDGLSGSPHQGYFSLSGFLFSHLTKSETITLYSNS